MGRILDMWAVAVTQAQLTFPTIHRLVMAKILTIQGTTHHIEVYHIGVIVRQQGN